MFALFLKCALGAAVVLLISILSKSKAFYIAGLVPLFPTFALIAHVIVSQQQGQGHYRKLLYLVCGRLFHILFIC